MNSLIYILKSIFTLVLLATKLVMVGQDLDPSLIIYKDSIHQSDSKGIFLTADQMPEYIGGLEQFHSFVESNLKNKYLNRELKSRTYVSFIVTSDGNIREIKTLKGVDKRLNNCVRSALRKMPKWKPGSISNKAVNVRLTFSFYY